MSTWGQLALQDAASPIILQLIYFHDHAILVVTLVVSFVRYIVLSLITSNLTSRQLLEANTLETIWTILPAGILVFLALPSLRLLYLIDEIPSPQLSVKTIGRQWYWSYEYINLEPFKFDSFIKPAPNPQDTSFRLLEVDHRATFPTSTESQLLVTSSDVIHSWTVPSLGVKVDAIPGRQNQVGFSILRPGVFYGQCSEICGTDHSFIPIAIEAISPQAFLKWVNTIAH